MNVQGQVKLEYVDAMTGKVKECLEDKNHVFDSSFGCGFWSRMLVPVGVPTFFVTDDNTPPSDAFPYMRGRIVGIGNNSDVAVWGGASDKLLGTLNPAASIPWGADIGNGNGKRYRYVFDFETHQIPGNIGSFGFTAQCSEPLAVAGSDVPFVLKPHRERVIRTLPLSATRVESSVFRGQHAYRLWSEGIPIVSAWNVGVWNMLDSGAGSHVSVNVTEHIRPHGISAAWYIGKSFDSDRTYLLRFGFLIVPGSSTVLMEFEDGTFKTLLNTYALPSVESPPNVRVFAVAGHSLFFCDGANMVYLDNFNGTSGWQTVPPFDCPAVGTVIGSRALQRNTGHNRHVTIENGILCGHGEGLNVFYDTETKKPVASVMGFSPTGGVCRGPGLDEPVFLSAVNWQYGLPPVWPAQPEHPFGFVTNQALCAYAVPDGFPPRPDNSLVSIRYTIDALF